MCQKTLAEQASKAIFSLKSNLVKYSHVSTDILFKIFDTKIQPILTYGAEIRFPHTAADIEIVNTKFCKYVLKLPWQAPNNFVRGELGRFPLTSYLHAIGGIVITCVGLSLRKLPCSHFNVLKVLSKPLVWTKRKNATAQLRTVAFSKH